MYNDPTIVSKLSKEPFGEELALKLADALETGSELVDVHRDYCGHGLKWKEGKYTLFSLHDASISIIHTWDTKEAFVSFWAAQSDFICAGAVESSTVFYVEDEWYLNNQTITKQRIIEFIQSS